MSSSSSSSGSCYVTGRYSDLSGGTDLGNSLFFPTLPKGEAVFARCLSSLKDERVQASKLLNGPKLTQFSGNKKAFLEDIRKVSHCVCQSTLLKLLVRTTCGCLNCDEGPRSTFHSTLRVQFYYFVCFRPCMLPRLSPMLKASCC